jgi:FtsH-binding integral membrane protein
MQPYPVMQSTTAVREANASFVLKVYNWMTMGLALTAIVALGIETAIPEVRTMMLYYPIIFWGLLIMELVLVWGLSAAINRIPVVLATLIFLFYAALNGVTLSVIFLVYQIGSIAYTFFITAAMFGVTSVFGYVTKMDLTKVGGFLFMGLIGIILASVVNMFVASRALDWLISYIGVFIFVGLAAYDTQKIKNMSMNVDSTSEEGNKASIMGALALYLDFINLFLLLLRIMGKRK